MQTISVVGGRNFEGKHLLNDVLDTILSKNRNITRFVSGGAMGTDSLGEEWARRKGLVCKILEPDWNQHGKAAGIIRNESIIKHADFVVAFWNGRSRGTRDSICRSIKTGRKLFVIPH